MCGNNFGQGGPCESCGPGLPAVRLGADLLVPLLRASLRADRISRSHGAMAQCLRTDLPDRYNHTVGIADEALRSDLGNLLAHTPCSVGTITSTMRSLTPSGRSWRAGRGDSPTPRNGRAAPTVASTSTLDASTHEVFSVDGAFAGTPTLAAGTYWLAIRDGAWGSVSDGTIVGWSDSSPVVGNVLNIALDEASPTSWSGTGIKDTAFVLNPVKVVPLPAAAWTGLGLLGILGLIRRRRP